jgi:hypothetical protein
MTGLKWFEMRWSSIFLIVAFWGASPAQWAQDIAEQKKAVAFAFGTVHPRNQDGTPMKNSSGAPLSLESPLGTVFFVWYPDARGGSDYGFGYLVTAKHVLKDNDGTFLKDISVRLNLAQTSGSLAFESVNNIPVADAQGQLTWFHDTTDDAVDVAVLPFLPEQKKFDYKAIPVGMFADEKILRDERVTEGDSLYFKGS